MMTRASDFYNKGLNAMGREEKIFCFYDAFFCLYAEDGIAKAAEVCGVSADYFKNVLNSMRGDCDCTFASLSDAQICSMQSYLHSVLC